MKSEGDCFNLKLSGLLLIVNDITVTTYSEMNVSSVVPAQLTLITSTVGFSVVSCKMDRKHVCVNVLVVCVLHTGGEDVGVNPKISNMLQGYLVAKYDVLWISDSGCLGACTHILKYAHTQRYTHLPPTPYHTHLTPTHPTHLTTHTCPTHHTHLPPHTLPHITFCLVYMDC